MRRIADSMAAGRRYVDYDRIAATYDRRFAADRLRSAGNDRSGTSEALCELVREQMAFGNRVLRVLEVGCGTGKWLADLVAPALCATASRATGLQVVGLDLSMGMLRQARRREPSPCVIQGRAERLPFPAETFDLVYCVNAIHHFGQPRAFIGEACRLLQPGGLLVVIGMDPHGRRDHWYVYHYFDGVYDADLRRFPSWAEIADWISAEGLSVECRIVDYIWSPKAGRVVLDDPFLQQDACSQLALLSREAYQAGLRRIEAALELAEAAGETLIFPVDTPLAMICGRLS